MFLAYDGIVFDMLFLDGWQVEADLSSDGCDFLRWHHIIDVTCVLNEQATAAYKFPSQQRKAEASNRVRAQEAFNRLNQKLAAMSGVSVTAQPPGENSKLKSVKQLENFFNRLNEGLFHILSPHEIVFPSGKVSTPPAVPSSNVKVPPSYGVWDRMLESIRFAAVLGQQQGSTYISSDGGPISTAPPAVSPSSTQATSNSEATTPATTAKDIAAGVFGGIGALIGAEAGAGVGSVVGAAGAAISGWWSEIQQQLTDLGNLLGIGANDIFGAGRQPPANVNFPTPPVRRNLNAPPPEAAEGLGVTGWTVPITFQELQNRLNKRGRTLAAWLNSGPDGTPEYMLFSPYVGFTTDALSGPVCRIMHIPAIHGNVTGILKLRFETWVAPPPEIAFGSDLVTGTVNLFDDRLKTPPTFNDTLKTPGFSQSQTVTNPAALFPGVVQPVLPTLQSNSTGVSLLAGGAVGVLAGNNNNASGKVGLTQNNTINNLPGTTRTISGNRVFLLTPPLLSNRWTMRQAPDPNTYLNTTIIEGTAHFRLDVLQALQITPDQLRAFFMHPIPFGYVRMPPEVTVLSDGASVQYQIVDVQQMMNNPGGQRWGVHSVKARQIMKYNSPLDFVRSPFAPTNIFQDNPKGMNKGNVFGV